MTAPEPGADAGRGRWEAVLFDLDGTLADTVELILRCYRHTMVTHLGEAPPDEAWLATIGTPLRDQLRDFARSDEEAEAMLETYSAFQVTVHDEMVSAFPGAREVVDALAGAGVPVGIVTSKRRAMAVRTLEACRLDGPMQVVVTADDVARGKPHPEPVHRALGALGVPPGPGVLFLGDSPWDIRAGKEAGTRTAAALWGPYSREALVAEAPDFLLREIGGLPGVPGGPHGASAGDGKEARE